MPAHGRCRALLGEGVSSIALFVHPLKLKMKLSKFSSYGNLHLREIVRICSVMCIMKFRFFVEQSKSRLVGIS